MALTSARVHCATPKAMLAAPARPEARRHPLALRPADTSAPAPSGGRSQRLLLAPRWLRGASPPRQPSSHVVRSAPQATELPSVVKKVLPGEQGFYTTSSLSTAACAPSRAACIRLLTHTNPLRMPAAGKPEPLGPSKWGGDGPFAPRGVNFALWAKHATAVTLCLYDAASNSPLGEVKLDAKSHRTGDVWHVALEGLPWSKVAYAYKVAGSGGWETGQRWDPSRPLLDPYAPLVSGRRVFGKRDAIEQFKQKQGSLWLGTFDFDAPPFDWGDEPRTRPRRQLKDSIIYEMSVRCFTADPSSGLPPGRRGTFLGVADKAAYLKDLGITAGASLFEFGSQQ